MEKIIPLEAGAKTRINAQCKSFIIASTGAASYVNLDVEFADNQQPESMGDQVRGFKMRGGDPSVLFQTLVLTAPVSTTVKIITSNHNIDFNYADGVKVTATIDPTQLPLQTANDKGAVGNPVYVSGVTYNDAPAVSMIDNAAVAVTSAGVGVLTALAARKSARFCNLGPDPVAIGFTGITWGKRTIVLNAEDTWVEDRSANLAWAAITDIGKTGSVTVQEVRT